MLVSRDQIGDGTSLRFSKRLPLPVRPSHRYQRPNLAKKDATKTVKTVVPNYNVPSATATQESVSEVDACNSPDLAIRVSPDDLAK